MLVHSDTLVFNSFWVHDMSYNVTFQTRLAFLKKLRTIAWRFSVIKGELLWCFKIAFAEAILFSVSCALSSAYFLVLVNDLYIGNPLEANKTQEICIFQ